MAVGDSTARDEILALRDEIEGLINDTSKRAQATAGGTKLHLRGTGCRAWMSEQLHCQIPGDLHLRLRVLAAERKCTITSLVVQALEDYFAERS